MFRPIARDIYMDMYKKGDILTVTIEDNLIS